MVIFTIIVCLTSIEKSALLVVKVEDLQYITIFQSFEATSPAVMLTSWCNVIHQSDSYFTDESVSARPFHEP